MSIKSLFRSKEKNLEGLKKSKVTTQKSPLGKVPYRFPVDYSNPQNFSKFGLAEVSYQMAFVKIYKTFPYDGTVEAVENWKKDLTPLESYVFNEVYPRSNGHLKLGHSWQEDSKSGQYALATTPQYITFHGGANKGFEFPGERNNIQKKTWFDNSNKWKTSENLDHNIELDFDNGVTFEFWLKKSGFLTGSAQKEVILDFWNNKSAASSSFGRLTLELTGSSVDDSCFRLTLQSSSSGFFDQMIGTGSSLNTSSLSEWNHFAVSLKKSSTNFSVGFFKNGLLNQNKTFTGSFSSIEGNLWGRIGGLLTSPSGSSGLTSYGTLISSSVDDFRLWKTKRSEKEVYDNYNKNIFHGNSTGRTQNYLTTYYKFNEGVTGTSSVDSIALDYSGRVNNGTIYNYDSSMRSTESAIVLSETANAEFLDPILYSFHPSVISESLRLRTSGSLYDDSNNSTIWSNLPFYLKKDEEDSGLTADNLPRSELKRLAHFLGTSFDDYSLAIENLPRFSSKEYLSGSQDPRPFIKQLLIEHDIDFPEIFSEIDSDIKLKSEDGSKIFENSLEKIKLKLYENLYASLDTISEHKGSDIAFRKALRAFGIDSDLVKIKRYNKNSSRTFETNHEITDKTKKYLSFYQSGSLEGTITQNTASESGNARSFIGYHSNKLYADYSPLSINISAYFPQRLRLDSRKNFTLDFLTSSIGGLNESSGQSDYTWVAGSSGSLNIQFVKKRAESSHGYFKLSGNIGTTSINLTSSNLTDVYEDTNWNLFVEFSNDKYPYLDKLSGSESGSYTVSFSGYESLNDTITRNFNLTQSVTFSDGSDFSNINKRLYLGSEKTNFTGSTVHKTDIGVFGLQVFEEKLSETDRREITKYGKFAKNPSDFRKGFASTVQSTSGVELDPENTKLLHWDFSEEVTSDSSGEFYVYDLTSGSSSKRTSLGDWGTAYSYHYPATGKGFPASFVTTKNSELPKIRVLDLDSVSPYSNVNILSSDDRIFAQNLKHQKDVLSFEISRESSLNGLLHEKHSPEEIAQTLGNPQNNFEVDYHSLIKKSENFFDGLQETKDHEKFFDYFKWLDKSLREVLKNFVPIGSPLTDSWKVVESHELERPKYKWNLPILDTKTSTSGQFGNTKFRLAKWSKNHRPVNGSQTSNGEWWRKRATRDADFPFSASVDADRETLRQRINTTSFYSSSVEPSPKVAKSHPTTGSYEFRKDYYRDFGRIASVSGVKGNSSRFITYKNFDMFKSNIKVDGKRYFLNVPQEIYLIFSGSLKENVDLDPNIHWKHRISLKARSELNTSSYISTDANKIMPFRLYSSSVDGGYHDNLSSSFMNGVDVTNLHRDFSDDIEATPIQGTFSERFVGGRSVRHVNVNDGTDTRFTRPEEFHSLVGCLSSSCGAIGVTGPDYPIGAGVGYPAWSYPRAQYYRKTRQKTPISLQNHKLTTSSFGNFSNNREILFLNKDHVLQHWFREGLTISHSSSPYVTGSVDYLVPTSSKSESHYIQRFSCPGDFGSAVQDYETSQYSIYNSVNYRNLGVREPLRELYTRRTAQFGVDKNDSSIGAFHKTPRNNFVRLESSGSSVVETTEYDNMFVQRCLPRKWQNHAWVISSYTGSELYVQPTQSLRGYIEDPGFIKNYTLNGKEGSFAINSFGVKSLNTSSFLLENSQDTSVHTINSEELLNSYLNNESSKFSYSPLTQTRVKERLLKNKKTIDNLYQVGNIQNNDHSLNNFEILEESPLKYDKPFFSKLSKDSKSYSFSYAGMSAKQNFANLSLNSLNNLTDDWKKLFVYDKLQSLEKDEGFEANYGSHDVFIYSKGLFPRLQNFGTKKSRLRENYSEVSGSGSNGYDRKADVRRTFWKETEKARSSHLNVLGSSWGDNFWPLGNGSYVHHTVDGSGYYMLDQALEGNLTDEFGELNNPFHVIQSGAYIDSAMQGMFGKGQSTASGFSAALPEHYFDSPTASAYFVYKPNLGKFSEFIYPYEVETLSGLTPSYNSYEDYAIDLKPLNKEYGLTSQYSYRENLDILQSNENLLSGNKKSFRLDGATFSSSSTSETGKYDKDFFETYSLGDVLRGFSKVKEDNKDKKIKKWCFKASVLKKLLPENGFYPVSFLTHLAGALSASYAPYLSGSDYETNPELALQSFMQPFYAPGLAFNAIKSGIAVDWPLLTSSLADHLTPMRSEPTPKAYFLDKADGFDLRLPFKALYDEAFELPSGSNVYLNAPDKLIESTGSANTRYPYFNWNGQSLKKHKNGFKSFIEGVKDFFVGDFSKIQSLPEANFKPMISGSSYYMDVILRKTPDFHIIKSDTRIPYSGSSDTYSYNGQYFGPPCRHENTASLDTNDDERAKFYADPAYAPFTPPYFYGKSRARLKFTPSETRKYSLDEIFAETTKNLEFINDVTSDGLLATSSLGNVVTDDMLARNSIMQITASVELFNKEKGEKEIYQGSTDNLSQREQSEVSRFDKWTINSIFECPVLNFSESPAANPASSENNWSAQGIWGTYGSIPTENEGIFLEVKESFHDSEKDNANITGSLLEVCGFSDTRRQVGTLKQQSKLEEALIVIPYINSAQSEPVVRYEDKFFFKVVNEKTEEKLKSSLRKFNLPPKFDFGRFEELEPFFFMTFEFDKPVQKNELSDIWQGVLPETLKYAEKDNKTFELTTEELQNNGIEGLPDNVQFMSFRVKKKNCEGGCNYYNWPHDYYSLIENVNLSVDVEFEK